MSRIKEYETKRMEIMKDYIHKQKTNPMTLMDTNTSKQLDVLMEEYKDVLPKYKEIELLKIEVQNALLGRNRNKATELLTIGFLRMNKVYSIRDDEHDEMWIYKEGIYVPQAKTYIEEFCRKILEVAYTSQLCNETIRKIKADTYIEQDKFFVVQDIYKIACENGILNLKTKELEPFNPEYFYFNKIPVTYDPTKDCPNIKKHLSEIFKDKNEKTIIFELAGYLLLRDYKIEKAFMFTGDGRNGKGKTIELLKNFIGIENCSNIPLQNLDQDQFAMGELFNKMANLCGDMSGDSLKGTGNFKTLTGHDLISAPRKFKPRVNFVNYAKLIFSANQIPVTYDLSMAFFNRWLILDFPYTFVSKKEYDNLEDKKYFKIADKELINKLIKKDELSGLLNESLFGLNSILENSDFSYSGSTNEVKKMWLRKSSSFNAFMMDCLIQDFGSKIKKNDLKTSYTLYCQKHKLTPISDKGIKNMLMHTFGVLEDRFRKDQIDCHFWGGIRFSNDLHDHDDYGFSTYRENLILGIDRESQVIADKQVKTNNNTIPIYSDDQDDHDLQETFTNISGKTFYITKPTHHKCHLCGSQPMEGLTLQDTSTGKYYCDDCSGKNVEYKEEKI